MSQWTLTEGGANLLVGPRLLRNETAVFRYPIEEFEVPYYNETFHKIASLAITGANQPEQKISILRSNVDTLPEILVVNSLGLAAFREGKSFEAVMDEAIGKVVGYHSAMDPRPLTSSFLYPGTRANLPLYVKALFRGRTQIWDRSADGIIVTANWQRAFDLPSPTESLDDWDDVIGIPSRKA
ncbi:MAG TPA: hypothetical protein VLE73_00195 [Candidatus Saccharimonadales bacterium]|nr:hypothetical protein [Candidatus Saccharimonadales bacterium]